MFVAMEKNQHVLLGFPRRVLLYVGWRDGCRTAGDWLSFGGTCSKSTPNMANGNSRILKWRYVSTIFWAIFCGDHETWALYMVGTSNQSVPVAWPLIISQTWMICWYIPMDYTICMIDYYIYNI